jgi:hypothetical protein
MDHVGMSEAIPQRLQISVIKRQQLELGIQFNRSSDSRLRLLDVTEANAALDEIGSTMRDALLNWLARVGATSGPMSRSGSNWRL